MGLIMRNRKCYTGKMRETNPLEWKLLGKYTGTTSLDPASIPNDLVYNELYINVWNKRVVGATNSDFVSVFVPKNTLSSSYNQYILGNGGSTNIADFEVYLRVSLTNICVATSIVSGNNLISQTEIQVYYR